MKRLLAFSLLLFSGLCLAQTPVNPLGPVGPAGSVQLLSASPGAIDFNTVQTSTTSQSQNITISSQGTIGVTISVSQTGSSDFVFSNLHGCDGLQASGAVCGLTLTFQPSSPVSKTGSLVITTDIPTLPLITIPLRGTGTAATTFPLTVTALDNGFGTIISTDGKISCTIAPPAPPSGSCGPINYASGTNVTLDAVALAGSTFQSLNGAGCSVAHCTFSMSSPGFTVAADFSANGPAAIASIIVAPLNLPFNQIQNNTPSPAQPIAISNPSPTVPVTVNSVVISDTHFAAANIHACDGLYNPGATCVLPIVFTPTAGISYSGTITVNSSAPVNPQIPTTVAVSGSGTPTPTFPLTVNGSPTMTGSGTITSDDGKINCHFSAGAIGTGQCSNNYASGSTPVLTATPDPNQTFVTFSGTGCGTTSPSTVTIAAAKVCTASFTAPIPTNTLSVGGAGQGTGTVVSDVVDVIDGQIISCTTTAGVLTGKCKGTFNQGTLVTLTETPFAGCTGGACTFTSWGGVTCLLSACPVTVNSNLTVSASFAAPPASAPVQLIQTIPATRVVSSATAAVTWSGAQGATDNLVFYAMWDGTATVNSITDTKGNTYTQSTCSPIIAFGLKLVAYHASNIVAATPGANTTTLVLSATPPSFFQVYGGEYSGLAASPVDVCHSASGNGTAVNSGNFTTTVAGDLLTAASFPQSALSVVSPGWTQQVVANFGFGDYEDLKNQAIGTYANAPTQTSASNWLAIGEAWKAAGSGSTPVNFSFNVNCGPVGSGTVTASGQTLTCTNGVPSGGISLTVPQNSTQTLVANPLSGSAFANYQGGGCGTNPTCTTAAITTNTTVTALFSLAGTQQFFVSPSGNDTTGNGSQATPWRTADKCASTLTLGASGTVCNFASGTYPKVTTARSGTATQLITFNSTTPLGAQIVASGCNTWANSGNFVHVVGFDMTGDCSNGVSNEGSNTAWIGNKVHDLPGTGGFGGIVICQTVYTCHDNAVIGNIVDAIGPLGGTNTIHGIYVAGPNNLVENNIVSRASAACITSYHGATHLVVSNNTVMNCGKYGIQISADPGTTSNDSTSVMNNIIVNVPGPGIQEFPQTGPNNSYKNNIVYNNAPNLALRTGTATGTITLSTAQFNALFVSYTGNAQTGNYVLQVGAAGINAGISGFCASGGLTPCEPNFDFNNATRPQGTAPDIGAFEQ